MNEKNTGFWEIAFLNRSFHEFSPVLCGYEFCKSGHMAYGHRPYWMIHYVISGKGILYCESGTYNVSRGQIFIIKEYENAHYISDKDDPWEYTWIAFTGTLSQKFENLPGKVFDFSYEPFSIVRTLKDRTDTREEMASAALFMIYSELFSGRTTHPHYVRRVVDTVNSLYMNHITVEGLADTLGLDRRYLARIFKASMGISIRDYLIKVRMQHAQRLLREGISVALTAELVGYNDPFNFSKMFKKYFGESPSRYR